MVDDGCCPVMRLIPLYLDEGWGREAGGLSRGKRNVVIIICLLLDNRMLQVVKLTVLSMQHQYCLLLGDDTPRRRANVPILLCGKTYEKKAIRNLAHATFSSPNTDRMFLAQSRAALCINCILSIVQPVVVSISSSWVIPTFLLFRSSVPPYF